MSTKAVNVLEVPECELREALAELQELQARGAHRAATEFAINFLFAELGEPGAGEQ